MVKHLICAAQSLPLEVDIQRSAGDNGAWRPHVLRLIVAVPGTSLVVTQNYNPNRDTASPDQIKFSIMYLHPGNFWRLCKCRKSAVWRPIKSIMQLPDVSGAPTTICKIRIPAAVVNSCIAYCYMLQTKYQNSVGCIGLLMNCWISLIRSWLGQVIAC